MEAGCLKLYNQGMVFLQADWPISTWARVFGLMGGLPLLAVGILLCLAGSFYVVFAMPIFFLFYVVPPALLVGGALRAPKAPGSAAGLMLGPVLASGFFCWKLSHPSDPLSVFQPSAAISQYADFHILLAGWVFGAAATTLAFSAAACRRTGSEPRLGLAAGLPVALALGAFSLLGTAAPPILDPIKAQGWVTSAVRSPTGYGKPVAGVLVTFRRHPHESVVQSLPLIFETKTNEKGWYELAVPPSYYSVELRHPDFEPRSAQAALIGYNERKTSDMSYELKPNVPGDH